MDPSREPIPGDGLGVTHRTWENARDALRAHLVSFVPAQVITLTPEMCVRTSEDAGFRAIVERAAVVVADGVGVVWGEARLTGRHTERIPGIDLANWALEEVDRMAGRVYLLGGRSERVERAAERLSRAFPRVTLAGWRDGYFRAEEEAEVVAAIAETTPHLVLVGMGSPRQERFISSYLHELRCAVAMGVGGAIDVWSGAVRRAPALFRATGTEWMYRTLTEPGARLRRLPTLWRYVSLVLRKRRLK